MTPTELNGYTPYLRKALADVRDRTRAAVTQEILAGLGAAVLKAAGQAPPSPGLVFDKQKHRWVRPTSGGADADGRHNPDLDAAMAEPPAQRPRPPADPRHNPDLDAAFGMTPTTPTEKRQAVADAVTDPATVTRQSLPDLIDALTALKPDELAKVAAILRGKLGGGRAERADAARDPEPAPRRATPVAKPLPVAERRALPVASRRALPVAKPIPVARRLPVARLVKSLADTDPAAALLAVLDALADDDGGMLMVARKSFAEGWGDSPAACADPIDMLLRKSGTFDESEHPRDHGKFSSKPGGSGGEGKPASSDRADYAQTHPAGKDGSHDVTKTAEFHKWFSGSTVTNPDGSPRIMYHSTPHTERIHDWQTGDSDGIFFAPEPITDPDNFPQHGGQIHHTEQVYLDIKNPLKFNVSLLDFDPDDGWASYVAAENMVIADAKDAGHDGVIFTSRGVPVSWVVFDGSQIRHADEQPANTPADRLTKAAADLGLSLQLEDLREGVRRGVAEDEWEYADLLADLEDHASLERITKADRSHLVRKVIQNRLGRRQVVWMRPEEQHPDERAGASRGQAAVRGQAYHGRGGQTHLTQEQQRESRAVIAQAVADPSRINPEVLKQLPQHINAISKEEAKDLLRQMRAKVSGSQYELAVRLYSAVKAAREAAGGVGDGLAEGREPGDHLPSYQKLKDAQAAVDAAGGADKAPLATADALRRAHVAHQQALRADLHRTAKDQSLEQPPAAHGKPELTGDNKRRINWARGIRAKVLEQFAGTPLEGAARDYFQGMTDGEKIIGGQGEHEKRIRERGAGGVSGPAPDTGEVKRDAGKPKVEYVRAPAGGAVSDVDGKHYRGGQLMPVHGKYSGMQKPPKGDGVGTGDAVQANPEAEGGPSSRARGAVDQEESRQRAADQKKWDEMNAGPLGKILWLGTSPNSKAGAKGVVNLKEWREYAEKLGPDGVKRVVAALEPQFHAAVDKNAPDTESADWYKTQTRANAGEAVGYLTGGKGHEKNVPDSHYARQLVQEMLDPQNTPGVSQVDRLHRLNTALAEAEPAPAPIAPAGTPTPDPSSANGGFNPSWKRRRNGETLDAAGNWVPAPAEPTSPPVTADAGGESGGGKGPAEPPHPPFDAGEFYRVRPAAWDGGYAHGERLTGSVTPAVGQAYVLTKSPGLGSSVRVPYAGGHHRDIAETAFAGLVKKLANAGHDPRAALPEALAAGHGTEKNATQRVDDYLAARAPKPPEDRPDPTRPHLRDAIDPPPAPAPKPAADLEDHTAWEGDHRASGLSFRVDGNGEVSVRGNTRAHAAALKRAGFRFVDPTADDEGDVAFAPGYRPDKRWVGTLQQAVNLDVPRSHDLPDALGVRVKNKIGGGRGVTGDRPAPPPTGA